MYIAHNAEYDLHSARGRSLLRNCLERHLQFFTVMALPCTVWSAMVMVNMHLDHGERRRQEKRTLRRVVQTCRRISEQERYFLEEQPATAAFQNWKGMLDQIRGLPGVAQWLETKVYMERWTTMAFR